MIVIPRCSLLLPLGCVTLLSACLDWSSSRAPRRDAGSDGDASEQPDPNDGDDAGAGAERDAAMADDAAVSDPRDAAGEGEDAARDAAGGQAGDASNTNVCSSAVGCSAQAPCVPSGDTYTCQGRYADYPLPVRSSGGTPAQQGFVVQGDTILDSVTGLMWPRRCTTELMTLAEANAYCTSLVVGEFNDFRLAGMKELSTLWGAERALDIDPALFLGCDAQVFHTATLASEMPGSHWIFNDRMVLAVWGDEVLATGLCVRTHMPLSAPPAERFVGFAAGDALTHDATTKLLWESFVASDRTSVTYAAAEAYCAQLVIDEREDFRLPTAAELISFVDYEKPRDQRVPASFIGPTDTHFWSRTQLLTDTTRRQCVSPDGNASGGVEANELWAARCVAED